MKKKLIAGVTGAAASLAWAGQTAYVFAQTFTIEQPENVPTDIGNVVNALVKLAFMVAGILVLFFLIFGGIKWIMSGGDQKKTEEARNMIMAAVVGLVIVALSLIIVLVLQRFFGINIIGEFTIPSAVTGQ